MTEFDKSDNGKLNPSRRRHSNGRTPDSDDRSFSGLVNRIGDKRRSLSSVSSLTGRRASGTMQNDSCAPPPAGKSKKKNKNRKKGGAGQGQPAEDAAVAAVAATNGQAATSETSNAVATPAAVGSAANVDQLNISKLLNFDLRVAMEVLNFQQKNAKDPAAAASKNYQFWSTQPVPRMDEQIAVSEPIEPEKSPGEIRTEPYSLPEGFHWETLELEKPEVLRELYTLLNENYVEDDDCMFRFDYQPAFLEWALRPPGWRKTWHTAVRVTKSKRLVGFISAVPADLRIYDRVQKVVEINFLCVHKKLRSKRVAPVLIREITRRVNLTGIFQGVYTAGKVLPKPIATCRYWHRSLNPKKLIDIEFSRLSKNMTMQRTLKLYKLPDAPKTSGFRPMVDADCDAVVRLLNEYLNKFDLAPVFTEEEFKHWFVPKAGIIDSFVVADQNGKITDFVSYYSLPSTVMNHPVHKTLKAAYSFYNVATETSWINLMTDALISAKNAGFDVFNALDLMDNQEFLSQLKFGIGDGDLQYYLYNWRCPNMEPRKIGLVLQ